MMDLGKGVAKWTGMGRNGCPVPNDGAGVDLLSDWRCCGLPQTPGAMHVTLLPNPAEQALTLVLQLLLGR